MDVIDITRNALDYLSKDPLLSMGMIVPLQRNTATVLYAADDGVCLKESKSGAYMLSVACYEAGIKLLDLLPDSGLFTIHQEFLLDSVKKKVRYSTLLENYQAVYLPKDRLSDAGDLVIKPLNLSHFEIICESYDIDVGDDYLQDRLVNGDIFGGYSGDVLIGFVGIHAEGSIGLLKVFDKYLQRGYGKALIHFVVNHQLDNGITPFAQINVLNNKSLSLFRKIGFTISDGCVYWLF